MPPRRHLLQRQRRHQQRHVVAACARARAAAGGSACSTGNLGARRRPPSRSSNRRLNTVTVSPISDAAGRPARRGRAAVASMRARTALDQRRGRAPDALRIGGVGVVHVAQHGQEAVARAAGAVARREVRAAEERLALGRQPDAHRPAARAGQRLHRGHVDRVDVGALFAVDLDADVVVVHHGGDLLVLERLLLHHVAPVAGRVADRQEHRLAQPARLVERLVAPRPPVDRVVRVLQQVRAGLVDQPVGVLVLRRARTPCAAA